MHLGWEEKAQLLIKGESLKIATSNFLKNHLFCS